MQTNSNFRVRVMSYAHVIFNSSAITWSDAMRKAWQLYKLAKAMRKGVVKFVFEKVDGSARIAYGTLCNLPAGITSKGGRKAPNFSTMCYWDTKKQAFRSFRVANFIAIAV
ncbi:MAG: DUF2693 domain-containing protein [Muribaculaceae bacterium]|nr:DUF2693 domain-containing protein [Muribaculaceae bacterium]